MERKKVFGTAAAIVAAGGLLGLCGLGAWKSNNPEMSDIVAGVPVQIEGKSIVQGGCTAQVGVVCADHHLEYQLKVEQCPEQDVAPEATAKDDTHSLNPALGQYGAACLVEIIVVSEKVYEDTSIGGIHVLPGDSGTLFPRG